MPWCGSVSDEAKPLLLTEGPETGLSVWLATGYETFIALGAMSNHQPPPNRVVVVCRDDDPLQSAADKGLTRALTAWRQGDADVRIATPWPERRGDRSDFNDVLQVGGGAAVRARIEAAIRPQPTEGRPVRLPLGEARTTLSGAMKCFFTAAAAFDEKMATTLETARTEVTDDIEAKAPDDVRAFMARRVAAHTARAVAHEAQRAATEARAKVRMARQATAQAREAFIVARVTAARSSPADRLAARAQRERLSDAWHRACEDLVAARLDAAAARTVRRAATDAAKPRAAAEETTQLKNAAARTTREIGRLAEEHAAIAVGPPPYHALRVDVGGGKSTEARHLAAIRLAEMRAAGDGRTALFMVPTITLADEQARLFINLPEVEAAGLTAAVWRGRQRPDPDHLDFDNRDILDDYKTKMCRDPDAVADAQEALADVQTSVCRRKNPDGTIGSQCRFYEECGYQAQRDRRADIWFAAHEMLFERKPEAMGKPAFVIVDESAWQDGLIGIGSDRRRLSLDTLAQDVTVQDDPLAGERLRFLRRRAFEALSGLPDGPVPRAAIEETGMTSQSAAEARAIEWQSKVDAAIFPGMSIAARKAAVKAAANNKTIARLSLFWRAIEALMQSGGPAASGWAKLTVEDARNGAVRTIELKGRKEIAAEMVLPTLILDATMQPDLLRWFWPNLEVTADIAIRTLHQRVVQVQDRTYSKNHLRQPGNFRDIRAILFRLAREYAPGRVLGVIQQEFEEALRSCGGLPDNLDLAHHNDVAGKDGWLRKNY